MGPEASTTGTSVSIQDTHTVREKQELRGGGAAKHEESTKGRLHYAKSYRPFELFVNENYKL